MNWNLLRDFFEIARHESFTDAANAMGIHRPAVSKRIAELEEFLGFSLLNRKVGLRDLYLTERGEYLHAAIGVFAQSLSGLSDKPQRADSAPPEVDALASAEDALAAISHVVRALRRERRDAEQ
ncbi:helix-turn-helix domain-containing protein [Trinickia terrae]|uniref:helix-turn-helix domain-containing protein n=1 Tax=Trinickia terrae TaxID=2571161 RepID=UPI00146C8ADA|nr:LysR family transcriptional regulator [Trinickia terrae]